MSTPTVTFSFENPRSSGIGHMDLDVMVVSNIPGQSIFGINFRYFYDSFFLKSNTNSVQFMEFLEGYGVPPFAKVVPVRGNSSAIPAFGTKSNPVYVNSAVQYLGGNSPVLDTKQKLLTIRTETKTSWLTPPCTPFIWDKKKDPANGGFLSGSDGLVVTVRALPGTVNPNGVAVESQHALVKVVPFNWEYTGNGLTPPFGKNICPA